MADSEQFVHEVAERLRAIVAEAEERAARIVRDAEQEAARIRARAESEARERLDEVRQAFEAVEGKLGRAPAEDGPPPPPPAPEPPEPLSAPEPPAEKAEPELQSGDDAGARLVAMNMALEGAGRDEIVSRIAAGFDGVDAGAVTDEVLAKAAK